MLQSLSWFPPHNVLQVKAGIQEAESATPPLTIMAENVTSATTTQVTKVTAYSLVRLAAGKDLILSGSTMCFHILIL